MPSGTVTTPDGCWCCGQECMFCADIPSLRDCAQGELHQCAECRYHGCAWCCHCDECHERRRGNWSPEGIQIRHGGAWDRVNLFDPATRRAAPSSGDTLRTGGSKPVADGTAPDRSPVSP